MLVEDHHGQRARLAAASQQGLPGDPEHPLGCAQPQAPGAVLEDGVDREQEGDGVIGDGLELAVPEAPEPLPGADPEVAVLAQVERLRASGAQPVSPSQPAHLTGFHEAQALGGAGEIQGLGAATRHGQDPLDGGEEQGGTGGRNPEQALPACGDPEHPLGILIDREDAVPMGTLGPADPLEATLLQRVELAFLGAQPEAPGLARPEGGDGGVGLAAPRRPLDLTRTDHAQGVVRREAPDGTNGVLADHPKRFFARSADQGEPPERNGIEDVQAMVFGARPQGAGAILQQGEWRAARTGWTWSSFKVSIGDFPEQSGLLQADPEAALPIKPEGADPLRRQSPHPGRRPQPAVRKGEQALCAGSDPDIPIGTDFECGDLRSGQGCHHQATLPQSPEA